MSVTWIASYPKSGNTWVRFLLDSYFQNASVSSVGVNKRVPDSTRWKKYRSEYEDQHVLVKTHLLPGLENIKDADTKSVIYIQRHPKDVLVSAINFLHLTKYTRDSGEKIARDFCTHFGLPIWKEVGSGSYLEHVYSWRQTGYPTLVVHYENLKADPIRELRKMIDFLGHEHDPVRVAKAVENCELEKLKKIEKSERVKGVSPIVDKNVGDDAKFFFNKGAVGASLDIIAPGLDDLFAEYFGKIIQDLV